MQKEKYKEKSMERKQESNESANTPKQVELEQYESFGLKDDSIKHDFKTFLHSVSDSCISRQDISHVYSQWNYYFLTVGGFVDSGKQTIEKYDPKQDACEDYDVMKHNRAKFGLALLLNGNYLIMGGKQDGVRVNTCLEYSTKDKKMLHSPVLLNSCRSGFGVVTMNELIYLIGGNDGQSTSHPHHHH